MPLLSPHLLNGSLSLEKNWVLVLQRVQRVPYAYIVVGAQLNLENLLEDSGQEKELPA